MRKSTINVGRMTRLAILVALELIMAYTPLGYFRTAGLEITFLMIPVVIGAIILGPAEGAILGGIFGLTSFGTCFGASTFGGSLLAINPFFTFVTCFFPRLLAGLLCGYLFRALHKVDRTKLLSFGAASLGGALLNTFFFMTTLMLSFGSTPFIQEMMAGMNVIPFVLAFVGLQGLLEAVVCFIAGTAISKALQHFLPVK